MVVPVLTQVGHDILTEGGHKNSKVYRGILRLMGQFGYVSIEEVMFGFGLALQEAINRLCYLERALFIVRFSSRVKPESFFSLTPLGRQAVMTYRICDHFYEFHPSKYRLTLQNHDRMIIKTYLALMKVFKTNFKGWISEHQLRKEGPNMAERGLSHRVFDGEFHLKVHKEKVARNSQSQILECVGHGEEVWRCGLELELTLKSSRRYDKQFSSLYHAVYEPVGDKQKVPLVLFLYHSRGIYERLVNSITADTYGSFGRCVFVFGEAERFIRELEATPFIKFIGKKSKEIKAGEMNHIRVQVDS